MSEDITPPCFAVAAIMFRCIVAYSSVYSDLLCDGGSSLVRLSALSSIKAVSNPAPRDKMSRFSARGLRLLSLLVYVWSVY